MPTVTMPQLGESVEEGTIGKWLKSVGDHLSVGDPLVEVITDKVNAEVPSPFEGTLTKILANEGDTVGSDAVIAEVDVDGVPAEATPATDAEATPATDAEATPATDAEATPATDAAAPSDQAATEGAAPSADAAHAATGTSGDAAPAPATAVDVAPAPASPQGGNGVATAAIAPSSARMTPAVRRLAREYSVDLGQVGGTGVGGRITRGDVERAVAAGAAGSAPPGSAPVAVSPAGNAPAGNAPASIAAAKPPVTSPVADGDSLKKLTPMRKAIAKQMTRSLEVPTAYIMVEVDMSSVVRRRSKANPEYKAREGMSLSYVAFVTKACVEALRKHPDINAHWTEEGHWRRKAINVGLAVAVDDGLVVPVIKDADGMSLHGLNVTINDLATRARSKKIQPDEMRGGTFTVDNTGWTGSILTLPIINVPEVAIITMEKVVRRPVVIEEAGGDAIAVRSMMNMCIAIDHRATDGAQAGEFLADVRGWLESVDDNTLIW